MSGKNDLGGIVGCTEDARVQDCGNTGNVKPTGIGRFCGGIAGSVLGSSHIHNCYNVDSSTADKFYDGSCYHSNCYYLANGSDSTDKEITAKTQAQFASGEVAYLLQKPLDDAAEAGTTAEQVWGQKIGTDDYPKLGGDKVYQSAPCPANYSNTQRDLPHDYVDGVCSRCGEHEPPKEVNGYYQITNQWQLYWFAKWVNGVSSVTTEPHPGANAILVYDITLNSNVLNENGELNTGASVNFTPWTPIGTEAQPFTGTFDGDNKTISGLYIDGDTNNVGLFGCVGTNGTATGTVKKVTLADSYVRGNQYVGGICGWNKGGLIEDCHNTGTVSGGSDPWAVGGVCGMNYDQNNSSTIQDCDNSGKVSGKNSVGGVCGNNNNNSTLQKCHNTGKVSGTMNVGGVCGYNYNESTLKECYNTGTVSGGNDVGGVCGYSHEGTLEKCYNTGDVTGTGNYTGGVCGINSTLGTLKECYNEGIVSGASYTGGVCGGNISTLEKSYNTGEVIGTKRVGGVCGQNQNTVNGCYNIGKVTGNDCVGSVCGQNYGSGTVEKCYYLAGTSKSAFGDGSGVNCESKTEIQFKNGAVAYLLQKDLGINTQVWGQRIDGTGETDKTPVLSNNPDYAVHPAAEGSLCKRYSNTSGQTFNEHEYDDKTRVCSR